MNHEYFLIFILADGDMKVAVCDKPIHHPELAVSWSFRRDQTIYHIGFVGALVRCKAALYIAMDVFEAFVGVGSELALN